MLKRIKLIIILISILVFSYSNAEEIKLSCKGVHTSKNFPLGENIKEIKYEEDLLLDTEKKRLFWINIRQSHILDDGTIIEAHKPLVFKDLTPTNLIQFYDENENVITFANAYLNKKLYSMEQFLKLDLKSMPSSTTLATYFYGIDKKTFNIDKRLQTESASLPIINFTCEKINY
ncbi:hypothetical protein [Candidatus Pelagibacter sp. HIMB1746]|uniref:hypothetical protein n=1 Tax=Candidatus Pelagibacter sp. HIMB1746 TaxID=3413370 RepID=UPI003F87AC8B